MKTPASKLAYYAIVASAPSLGLLILLITKWIARGYIAPFDDRPWDGYAYILPPALYFLSLPAGFTAWLYAVSDAQRINFSFSRLAALISFLGFLLAGNLDVQHQHNELIAATCLGCIAGCFVFVPFRAFRRLAFRNERITCVAMMAITASAGYSLLDNYLWERMAYSAARSSEWLISWLPIEASIGAIKDSRGALTTMLASPYFTILVYQPCSGLEGIFLLIFLLSMVVLWDWKILRHLYLIETYLMGVIFMYAANVLRIVSLFLLGHYASAPDAGPWLASMQGLPLHMFHSFIGQFYYIIVFMIFSQFLYRYALKREAISQQNPL